MPSLPVALDRDRPVPLGVQLSGQIRELVLDGRLRRGDRLPSSRALASELGVSRSVAEQAYEQLLAEAWLEARRGSGTYVASSGPAVRARRTSRPVRRPTSLVRLDAGSPWVDPRHEVGWRRAWREVAAARPPRGYDDPRGIPELREALADHLARTRGLACDPDEVLVTHGTADGVRFANWATLRSVDGQTVSVISVHASPTYTPLRTLLIARLGVLVAQLSPAGPVLVGGDLNVHYLSRVYPRGQLAAAGLVSTFDSLGQPANGWATGTHNGATIDYLLATSAVQPISHNTYDLNSSDHRLLMGTFHTAG